MKFCVVSFEEEVSIINVLEKRMNQKCDDQHGALWWKLLVLFNIDLFSSFWAFTYIFLIIIVVQTDHMTEL